MRFIYGVLQLDVQKCGTSRKKKNWVVVNRNALKYERESF